MKFSKFLFALLPAICSSILLYGQNVNQDSLFAIIGQQGNPIVTAVPFLTITPDARVAGMGEAGGAISADANSSQWNAAKLAFIKTDYGFSTSYTPWLSKIVNDMYLFHLSGYYRLNKRQVIAGSMRYFDLGGMTFTDRNAKVIAEFIPREYAFDGTFAMQLGNFISGGVSARYIYSNLAGTVGAGGVSNTDTRPGQTASVDLSVYYRNDKLTFLERPATVAWGVNMSNVGFKISYSDNNQQDFIPTNLRLSGALTSELDSYNKLTFGLDINKMMVPTPPIRNSAGAIIKGQDPNRSLLSGMFGSFADAPNGFSEELRELIWATGMEYWYNDMFALRGGYFYEDREKGNRQYFTAGLGLRYQRFGLDFAYLIATQRRHPLEDTLRFTLTLNFSKVTEAVPATPSSRTDEI